MSFVKVTESDSDYHLLEKMTVRQLLMNINNEDKKVPFIITSIIPRIEALIVAIVDKMLAGGRLFYIGAGTSGRLGVLDSAEMPPTFGTDPVMVQGVIAGGYDALVKAQEGAEDYPEAGAAEMDLRMVCENDFVLGIATSGSTPFVHGALARARELGARTGFLLCTHPSPELLEAHDVVIAPLVGPEVITGSTRMKAGTATKLVLNSITTSAMVLTGKVLSNLMVDLQVTCEKLEDRGQRILRTLLDVDESEARDLLHHSGGNVKNAIVMRSLEVDLLTARALLKGSDGRVNELVGDLGEGE